jgi:lipoprotein-releasing system ATP-binding protein
VSTPRSSSTPLSVGLNVHDLSKSYPSGDRSIAVLDHLSLQLRPGENAAIVGPSGCGKSTLLYLLGTLEQPDSGTIEIAGHRPHELSPVEAAAFRNRSIGFVFQDHHLLPQLTVLENVLLPALATGAIGTADQQRAEWLIERVGLSHRRRHFPGKLSGGERQRVAVARSLLLQPALILADEPTGSLDESNAAAITELMLEMQREAGSMLLCVTHNPSLAERFQRTLTLNQGRFSDSGAAAGNAPGNVTG